MESGIGGISVSLQPRVDKTEFVYETKEELESISEPQEVDVQGRIFGAGHMFRLDARLTVCSKRNVPSLKSIAAWSVSLDVKNLYPRGRLRVFLPDDILEAVEVAVRPDYRAGMHADARVCTVTDGVSWALVRASSQICSDRLTLSVYLGGRKLAATHQLFGDSFAPDDVPRTACLRLSAIGLN